MNENELKTQRSNFTVCLLEDNPSENTQRMINGITDLLSIVGYKTRYAPTPSELLTDPPSNLPDLVILFNGYNELIELRIDENTEHLPIILFSGHSEFREIFSRTHYHFDALVTVPFSSAELVKLVDDFLVHSHKMSIAFRKFFAIIQSQNDRIIKLEKQIADLRGADT